MARTLSIVTFISGGTVLIAAVFCVLVAGFAASWYSHRAFFYGATAYGLAFVAITLLAVSAIASSRRFPRVVAILVSCVAIATAQCAAIGIAHVARDSEIRRALNAGLEDDCQTLFAYHQADPRLKEDGYIRVFRGSTEFDSLPPSIRAFNPIYVTIEDHPFGADMPANIGLCKNGFGGFAFGVRVFVDGESIPEPFWSKQITSMVYLWREET